MKDLKDMTFEELVQWQQANVVLSIPTGGFNGAIYQAMAMTLRWKAAQDGGE
jgi:hypothetical protein